MVAAVILAGGSSLRFGGVRPKQFYTINGKELLSFSLSVFKSCSNIDEIVLVVPENYLSDMKLKYPKLKVVSGGKTRKESSYNGLKACSTNTEKVLIHDAARIFITKKSSSTKIYPRTYACVRLLGFYCICSYYY